jgi:hypothetical protein
VHIATVTPTRADGGEASVSMLGKEMGSLTCHRDARRESI